MINNSELSTFSNAILRPQDAGSMANAYKLPDLLASHLSFGLALFFTAVRSGRPAWILRMGTGTL